ncbi:MAG: Uma2 family endonuclease [Methylococcales bacterium]
MQPVETLVFTANDYLEWEATQELKYEFLKGEVFAMGGDRQEHVVVSGNLFASLKQHLRNTPCRAYISDMKLRVEALDAFYYPDVMVSCDKTDHKAEQFLSNPSIIVEVLSDSTEAYDRGTKFAAYRHIDSLKEYFLIDIPTRRVECFRRRADNKWLLQVYENGGSCEFISLKIHVDLVDIFEDIE